jgi:hypothetical protein
MMVVAVMKPHITNNIPSRRVPGTLFVYEMVCLVPRSTRCSLLSPVLPSSARAN